MERFFAKGKKSPYYQEIQAAFLTMEKQFEQTLRTDHRVLSKAATHLLKKRRETPPSCLGAFGRTIGTAERCSPNALGFGNGNGSYGNPRP